MGEAKRKREKLSPVELKALELTHKLTNEGKLLAGGFAAYLMHRKMDPADPRVPELLDVYMSGAEHLWSSIFAILDPGADETLNDIRRMDAIQKEVTEWRERKMTEFAQQMQTKGSA